jgi:hypothetical protein
VLSEARYKGENLGALGSCGVRFAFPCAEVRAISDSLRFKTTNAYFYQFSEIANLGNCATTQLAGFSSV